jgi:hypothetical protein
MDIIYDMDDTELIEDGELVINSSYGQMMYLRVQTPKGSHFYHELYGNPFHFVGVAYNQEGHLQAINAMEDMIQQERRIRKAHLRLTSGIDALRIDVEIDGQEYEMRL